MKKSISTALAALFASTAFAGTYNDVTANNSFATAANLNPYFSVASSPDIGDINGANTSLAAPWVTINGRGNGNLYDFYTFTTNAAGRAIFDIDYTMGYTQGFDPYLNIYNASNVQIAANDDGGTTAGAGGSIHRYDSFIQIENLAAGRYYVRVGTCCVSPIANNTRQYTLQVQAMAPVPEPETYAMMLAGVGLIGGIARRKQKSA